MIILQDLFTSLATGAYSNTTFSNADGTLKEGYYLKVSQLINLGIVEIYKRFKFLENELNLHVTPETTKYYLRTDRVAAIDLMSDALYIEDATGVDGFLNIIKVTSVYDTSGVEISVNNSRNKVNISDSNIFIPTIVQLAPDILQITNLASAQVLNIVYQSYPNKIPVTTYVDPTNYLLDIPDFIVEPLISFIAAKTFKPMGANDSTANADKSASYEQQYELGCQKIGMYGLDIQDTAERETFASKGWA